MNLFIFLLSLLIILSVSQLMGFLANLVGQPKVVGEMIGGIIMGPTLLGVLFPQIQEWIFTENIKDSLYLLSQLGLSLYLFLVGMHVGKEEIKFKDLKIATQLAIFGIAPTFLVIFFYTWNLYTNLENPATTQLIYALFMSASISVTAFPVLIRILDQYKMIQTYLGRTIILGASIDDAIAWILLPIIIALSKFNFSFSSISLIWESIIYISVMFFIIKPFLSFIFKKHSTSNTGYFSLLILIFLFSSLAAEKIGLHCIFGGFIAGLTVPKNNDLIQNIDNKMSDFVNVLFVPVFFVSSGFNVNLSNLAGGYNIWAILTFIILAFATKYFSCMLYARFIGFNWRQASATGALMNARGLMILIFANIGLSINLISKNDYSVLFLIAIFTTALTSPLFKFSMHFKKDADKYEIQKSRVI
ncbi:hypothetical protein COF42_25610 [Bacillus wiedmannii]|nr:hypothetical protein COF42_25610 [Bacillus wiedmannii]